MRDGSGAVGCLKITAGDYRGEQQEKAPDMHRGHRKAVIDM